MTVASGGSGDTQVVMKVVETYEPTDKSAAAMAEDLKKRSNSAMSDDLLDQLVAKLQTEFPVTVNKALIERAIAN